MASATSTVTHLWRGQDARGMSNSFRIEESEMRAWHAALARRLDVRGVAALAKEVEAHLARKDADGTIVVTRHQLFTWAEALHGAAMRDPGAAAAPGGLTLAQVVAEMRAILSGKPVAALDATPVAAIAPLASLPARAPATPPPPVSYVAAPAQAGRGGVRVVAGAEVATIVRELVRSAKVDLYVSSPWATGIETLHAEIVALPKDVRVRILSRRPERDDGPFHDAMDQLGRRRAVTAWSAHIQTRLLIQDEERALVGAASLPGPASREIGVLVTDPAAVAALRSQFERAHEEAAGGKY